MVFKGKPLQQEDSNDEQIIPGSKSVFSVWREAVRGNPEHFTQLDEPEEKITDTQHWHGAQTTCQKKTGKNIRK